MRIDPLKRLLKGIRRNDLLVKIRRVSRGRFREEENAILSVFYGDKYADILHMKIFYGRPPYYKAWIEVFNINNRVKIDDHEIKFFNTWLEDLILDILSETLEGGEKLYIEYLEDLETYKALEKGIPPIATRLGYKLFKRGFTWFKDWYYPEGFMEGGPKLQAEKPLNEESLVKHIVDIRDELRKFINKRYREGNIMDKYYERIIEIINELNTIRREANPSNGGI